MKKRNSVKRQIPSIDDKELYEIYMRNHDECKKKIHKQIDACLDEAFPNSSSSFKNSSSTFPFISSCDIKNKIT